MVGKTRSLLWSGAAQTELFFLPTYVPTIYSPMHASLLDKKWLLAEYVRVMKNPAASRAISRKMRNLYTGLMYRMRIASLASYSMRI